MRRDSVPSDPPRHAARGIHGGPAANVTLSLYASARNAVTISENSSGACSNIQWRQPGMMAVFAPGTSAASARSTAGRLPLVSAPPMNRVGVSIDSRLRLRKRLSVLAGLSDQGEDVIAQLLFWRRGQAAPGAFAIDGIEKQFERALDVAGL